MSTTICCARRARRAIDYLELGNRKVTTFLTEMAALNWLPPDHFPRATEHIPQMQALIGRLLDKGLAYSAEGHVYFSIDADRRATASSRSLSRDEMLPIANERGNVPDMPGKRDPLDFVLWQRFAPRRAVVGVAMGCRAGRDGTSSARRCRSRTSATRFEIHGGGGDLIFPHHESELAQSEGATGDRPFVQQWTHAGMLHYEGEKMSKSLGNLVLVRDLLRTYSGDAIRHYLVSHHYRSEIDFHEADLERSVDAAAHLRAPASEPRHSPPTAPARADASALDPRLRTHRDAVPRGDGRDLDTPSAHADARGARRPRPRRRTIALAAQAGWMVRELGARILGLRLAPRSRRAPRRRRDR